MTNISQLFERHCGMPSMVLWIFHFCLLQHRSIWVPFETLRNYLLRENRFWHFRRTNTCLLFTNWMFADGILSDLLDIYVVLSKDEFIPFFIAPQVDWMELVNGTACYQRHQAVVQSFWCLSTGPKMVFMTISAEQKVEYWKID